MVITIRQLSSLALVLCVGSVFISCDKKNPAPETPGFRLFTNQLEITDATVKANFLKRSASKFPAVSPVGPTDKIFFLTPDTVRFGTSTIQYSVVKSDSRYVFYSALLIQGFNKDELLRDMLKYKAPKVAVPGYSNFDYATQEVRVGHGDARQIQISYLQYYWIRNNRLTTSWSAGFLFNELNEDIAPKVMAADTLAVQTGSTAIPVQ